MESNFVKKVEELASVNEVCDKEELLRKASFLATLSNPEQLTDDYAKLFVDNHDIWEAILPFEIMMADTWANELVAADSSEIRDQITAEIATLLVGIPSEHLLMLTEDIEKGKEVVVRDYLVMLLAGSDALSVIERSKFTLLASLEGMVDIYKARLNK